MSAIVTQVPVEVVVKPTTTKANVSHIAIEVVVKPDIVATKRFVQFI